MGIPDHLTCLLSNLYAGQEATVRTGHGDINAYPAKPTFILNSIKELPDVQAGFRKGRGTRDQLTTFAGSWKKQESSRKASISALLTMPKPLTVWITINCGKF